MRNQCRARARSTVAGSVARLGSAVRCASACACVGGKFVVAVDGDDGGREVVGPDDDGAGQGVDGGAVGEAPVARVAPLTVGRCHFVGEAVEEVVELVGDGLPDDAGESAQVGLRPVVVEPCGDERCGGGVDVDAAGVAVGDPFVFGAKRARDPFDMRVTHAASEGRVALRGGPAGPGVDAHPW